jgi:hypothetical protein
LMCDVA